MGKKNKEEQFFQQMEALIGASEARSMMESLDRAAAKTVRYHSGKNSPQQLKGEPVPWCQPFGCYWDDPLFPSRTLEYTAGNYYIQEASAMLAVAAAATVIDFSGKRVLDLTAAPGGKATQAAELIGSGTGFLAANEIVNKRIDALSWNINRHRLNNVVITSLAPEEMAERLPGYFDIVIVDAPCSGEGLFQRKKHSPLNWSSKNVKFCARRQQIILKDAIKMVRAEGYLVYSTCTFSREENEDRIEEILNMGFSPVPLPGPEQLPVSPAVGDNEFVQSCCRRIWPHQQQGAGAFVAVLRKEPPATGYHQPGVKMLHARENVFKSAKFPYIDAENRPGFFYEKNGVVSFFSNDRIPEFLHKNGYQIGAPLFDKRRASEPMFGCTQIPAQASIIDLDRQQANQYAGGLELQLSQPDGYYFTRYNGMVLGPVKIAKGKAANRLPRPLHKK